MRGRFVGHKCKCGQSVETGNTWECRACKRASAKRWATKNPSKIASKARVQNLRRRYGIGVEAYEALLAAQNGKCAICGRLPRMRRLAVDHDHQTGRIRGLLCMPCNMALGKLGDDVAGVTKALNYLLK